MKLERIGFYTLSDDRAKNVSEHSPLWRCELLITDECNFNCKYCRGLRSDMTGRMSWKNIENILSLWVKEGLRNVRFSGGEPTLHPSLIDAVYFCKDHGVKRIAVSTNGSASKERYLALVEAGVNDFSISLDGACCAVANDMSGGKAQKHWNGIIENIKMLSDLTYTTVGIVFTEDNISSSLETVEFAKSLGVSDIRVIPAAQYNKALEKFFSLSKTFLNSYPILKYRVENAREGRPVRGLNKWNTHHCWLALDDMAIVKEYHFPCIIYLREGGDPIGKVSADMRRERYKWVITHNTHEDPICKYNCLDVCADYNDKVERFRLLPSRC